MIRNLLLDPVESCVVSWAVLLLHEVGQVGHATQLVEMWRGQVLRLKNHRDPELLLGKLHGTTTINRTRKTSNNN